MIKKSSTLFLKPEAVQRTVVQNDWVLHYSLHKQTTQMHFIKDTLTFITNKFKKNLFTIKLHIVYV